MKIIPFLFLNAIIRAHVPTEEQVIHEHIFQHLHEIPQPLAGRYTIVVSVKLVINQIIDLDERQQILTTSIFIEQKWHHPRLSWTNLNKSSVKAIRMSETKIWTPDTYVHNNADDVMSGFLAGVYVLIYSNGDIQWPIRTQMKTFCPMDITMFPFDLQTCNIDIGSWVYKGHHHIFYNNTLTSDKHDQSADLSSYTDNSDWILVSAIIKQSLNNGITLRLTLRRRSFFYIWILIVPFVMLTVLSLMTFCMPSTSNEKLSLSLSVFMAFSMFMIMISERIPPATRHVPLIGVYLATIMSMTATSIFITVLIINIYENKGFERPSNKFRHIFIEKLAPLFKICHSKVSALKESKTDVRYKSPYENRSISSPKNTHFIPLLIKVLNIGVTLSAGKFSQINYEKLNCVDENSMNSESLSKVKNNVSHVHKNHKSSTKAITNNRIEWELIAVVLDNLFFYIFIITYLLIYVAIFLTPFIFRQTF